MVYLWFTKIDKDMKKETLNYVRVATKAKDDFDGLMYIHNWGTGYQYLIFQTDKEAKDYERKCNERANKA